MKRGLPLFFITMILQNQIEELISEKLKGSDIFLVHLSIANGNKIIVEVDKAPSITIEECVGISRYIENNLDREKEDFELKVSSPGLDKPLRHPLQYKKNVGRVLKVTSDDGSFKGELIEFENNSVTLKWTEKVKEEGKKKKVLKTFEKQFKIDNIKEAKVVVSF